MHEVGPVWCVLRTLRTPAMALCVLLGLIGPTSADQRSAVQPQWPEVLTLEEAALFLRVNRAELGQLAAWGQVPARRIGAHWRFSRTALLDWLKGDSGAYAALPSAGSPVPAPITADSYAYLVPQATAAQPLLTTGMTQVTARGTTLAQAGPPPTPPEQPEPIGEAPEEPTAEEVFLREQRVLLGAGEVTLELGLFYSRSDDQVVDAGRLATIEQDTFTASFTGRYGLTTDTELFASVPVRRQSSQTFVGGQEVSSTARTDTGDVRLGIRKTVLREGPGLPDVIVTVDGRIPTEESSYAVGGGVALVKSYDPVVLFGNANYRHTFARAFADLTRLDFDDRIDTTLGFAFALNDTLTLSTAVSGVFASETRFSNALLREQESFSLQFGLTSLLTEYLYIEPTVSFNLNGPGNSFVFGVSLPYTFQP